jgi:hypothetical protein
MLSQPHPIYQLSNRLLVFASSPTRPDSPTTSHNITPIHTPTHARTHFRPSLSGPFGVPVSQAEIVNAALKVGGTVLRGMKSLGGMAYSAAISWAAAYFELGGGGGRGGLTKIFFFRRALLLLVASFSYFVTHGSGDGSGNPQSSGSEAVLELLVMALRQCTLLHAHLSFPNPQGRNDSLYPIHE